MNAELDAVETNLISVAEAFESPLTGLVRAQIGQVKPFTRAAVVLAAGYTEPDRADLRAKRIYLASALEMLYVALSIHKLLLRQVEQDVDTAFDKTIVGSTVLAGDYCFSRSAAFATQTDSPQVVALFATALKNVSEGLLRHDFGHSAEQDAEDRVLFDAGIRAASVLTCLAPQDVENTISSTALLLSSRSNPDGNTSLIQTFPFHQQERWQQVRQLSLRSDR